MHSSSLILWSTHSLFELTVVKTLYQFQVLLHVEELELELLPQPGLSTQHNLFKFVMMEFPVSREGLRGQTQALVL